MIEKKLFKNNFLSSEFVRYKNKKNYITIEKLLERHFDIQTKNKLLIKEIISAGNINKNYLIIIGKNKFILKRLKNENSIELTNQLKLSNYLLKKKFNTISFLKTLDDRDFFHSHGSYWVLFKYIEGKYFSGSFEEFKEATKGFCKFTKILSNYTFNLKEKPVQYKFLLKGNLKKINLKNKKKLLCLHYKIIMESLDILKKNKISLKQKKIIHTDYHPQNLLFRNGKLEGVLDFQDVKDYSVIAAQGFAFFKLIRHSLSKNKKTMNLTIKKYKRYWINYWNKTFPLLKVNTELLRIGATVQIIHLINDILKRCSNNDFSQLHGLENQIQYLYEIETIFYEIT